MGIEVGGSALRFAVEASYMTRILTVRPHHSLRSKIFMAFKTNTFAPTVAANPAAHFKTLTKRQYPDVMPHQKDMLEAYAAKFEKSPDVALQLPTGSGKTLVGLLIADWRRIKLGDRAVYLCPTRQLVRQTVLQARNQ